MAATHIFYLFLILHLYNFISQVSSDSQLCGYLGFDDRLSRVNIFQNGSIPLQRFEEFYRNLSTAFLNVGRSECFIQVCGHGTIPVARAGKGPINPSCEKFYQGNQTSFNFTKDYEATSISCGCERNILGCEKQSCRSVNAPSSEACALLYQESKCQECKFPPIEINNKGTFKTGTGGVIRSASIQPECLLFITNFGYSEYDPETQPIQGFLPVTQSYNASTDLEILHTRRGQDFYCECHKMDFKDEGVLPDPASNLVPAIGWALGSLLLLLIVLTAAFFVFRKRLPLKLIKRRLHLDLEWFIKGGIIVKDVEGGDLENIPEGITQAFSAPYNPALEIPRSAILFGVNSKEPTLKDTKSLLGNGMFGVVFKGRLRLPGSNFKEVAIKTLKPLPFEDDECTLIKSMLNEIKVLAYIGEHQHIVQLIGAVTRNVDNNGEVFIILELCENGSLKKFLQKWDESLGKKPSLKPSDVLPEYYDFNSGEETETEESPPELCPTKLNQLFKWCYETAVGMEFLANKQVVHIDLAARNVLLDKNLKAKIGDFGLSRKLYAKLEYTKNSREPVPTRQNALESLTRGKFSVKSDIWSYGILLWEIFSLGRDPYGMLSYDQILEFLNSGKRLDCPIFATRELYEKSMLKCWEEDINNRPDFTQLKTYFHNFSGKC